MTNSANQVISILHYKSSKSKTLSMDMQDEVVSTLTEEKEPLPSDEENCYNDIKTKIAIEGVEMNSNIENKLDSILQSINNLAEQDKKLNDKIDKLKDDQHQVEIKLVEQSTKTTMLMYSIPILVTLIVSASTLFMTSSINSIKDEIKLQVNSLKEINSLQIQRDVSQEFLKQKK